MKLNDVELPSHKEYSVLSSLVVPRPIAWITSLNENGTVNLAPFSYFQLLGHDPSIVALGIGAQKHSFHNIRREKEFVIHLVTEADAAVMSLSAADFPEGMSETEVLGLKTIPASLVRPPRLATARASLEAREIEFVKIGNNPVIFGEIVAVHLDPAFLDEKLHVKTEEMQIIGRMQGGPHGGYSRTDNLFHVPRPSYEEWKKAQDQA